MKLNINDNFPKKVLAQLCLNIQQYIIIYHTILALYLCHFGFAKIWYIYITQHNPWHIHITKMCDLN
jgi:hypothetical protein